MPNDTPPLGLIEAVVATIGVVDSDGDIIAPGAVPDGAVVIISSWGHNALLDARVPIGVGTLHEIGNELRVKARLLLEESAEARQVHALLRTLGATCEWSFGYRIVARRNPTEAELHAGAQQVLLKLDAFEASPVARGAGIATRTVEAKRRPRHQCDAAAVAAESRALLLRMANRAGGPIRWRDETDSQYLTRLGFRALVH